MFGGLGRRDYEMLGIPSNAFVHVDDFDSISGLAKFMNETVLDPDKYNKFFEWHSTHRMIIHNHNNGMCELCRKLHSGMPTKRLNGSLQEWWSGSCKLSEQTYDV